MEEKGFFFFSCMGKEHQNRYFYSYYGLGFSLETLLTHTHINVLCVYLNKTWPALDILKVNFKEHLSFSYLSKVSVNINTLRFPANNSGSSTENMSKMKVFQVITSIRSLMFEGFFLELNSKLMHVFSKILTKKLICRHAC